MVSRHGEKVAGLLLAAGASTRMGRPKLLLPVEGRPMVERVLGECVRSDLDNVVVVLGYQSDRIREALGAQRLDPKVRVVVNPDYAAGMSTSIRAGLSEVEKDYDHVMVVLADMPFVNAGVIDLLMHRYLASDCVLGAVRVKSRRSHPVIFGRRNYPALMTLSGDTGARHLFQAPEKSFCLVDLGDAYDDQDIDTPEDYARLQERTFGRNPTRSPIHPESLE
jgi:molybdenum cofactor cytidylyltransferase